MKAAFFSVLFLFVVLPAFSQLKNDDYLKKWLEYKKQHVPFNAEKNDRTLDLNLEQAKLEIQLGDLQYKQIKYSVGQQLLGVGLYIVSAIKDWSIYNNDLYADPARYNNDVYDLKHPLSLKN